MARILKPGPDGLSDPVVDAAASILLDGGAVAYPTETFYGLGVNAENEAAVSKIFDIKGRDFNHPVSVIIGAASQLDALVDHVPPSARRLIAVFWPGPLTVVFQAAPDVSKQLTAGTGTIGVRLAGSVFARRLALKAGVAVTATSANRSGAPACTTAQAVMDQIGDRIDAVVDVAEEGTPVGSTIVDVTGRIPVILRPGVITGEEIRRKTGLDVLSGKSEKMS
ncbi:MAG TPA: L-threonylcarbamoyladenylate synthase [Smithellaceae bacterium]|nr:L-threonylcarbamoyladenylate synthase [Smithellaceae bacterium]